MFPIIFVYIYRRPEPKFSFHLGQSTVQTIQYTARQSAHWQNEQRKRSVNYIVLVQFSLNCM